MFCISFLFISSGKGTTHCTNGIIVQRKALTCELPPVASTTNQAPNKKRTVTCVPSNVLPYSSSSRKGPSQLNIDVDKIVKSNAQVSVDSLLRDFGWRLCRQPYQDGLFDVQTGQTQVIPAWTGFNTLLQNNNVLRECSVGYCEVVDASPTELPTVYTVLKRYVYHNYM